MNWINQLSPQTAFILFSAVKVVAAFAILMFMVAYTVLLERKICAYIQDRYGPNRVGPFGLLQPAADAVKAFLKEDFTPAHVHKVLFWIAPALAMIPAILNIAVIPFGSQIGNEKMIIADLNIGILYVFGIASISVYSILLAGYASNSKYPLIGGVRSTAQIVSYEVAMALCVVPVLISAGTMNLREIVNAQSGSFLNWFVFQQPLAFAIFLGAAFAETNRTPFDLPEAEQELAGGYNVEYSSIRFAMFFMGEYANMILASAMITTLFFGGWTLPIAGLDKPAQTLTAGIVQIAIFLSKVVFFLIVFIWTRWMFPRFRYDQLMRLGWKYFVPLSFANIAVTAFLMWAKK